tara:strand:- start:2882 stop:3424 length:543 start_codon:yes stop_codon:yes gene_type:complete
MERKVEFEINKTANTAKYNIQRYFEQFGFKTQQTEPNKLIFHQGSTFRNMITFNPLKWKSRIEITINEKLVSASFKINTIGQMVTTKEENLWDVFINNFQDSIVNGNDTKDTVKSELKNTYKSSLDYVLQVFLGALIFGIPGGIISHFTGTTMFVTGSAVGGALYFMHRKNQRDRAKRGT